MTDIDVTKVGPAPIDPRAEQVLVAMRDGVRLATDVYLPRGDAPVPAVLVRLPYDKSGAYTFMPWLADAICGRGYAFVVQDVRGKFRSEGETLAFAHEIDDGYDSLEWLSSQPWSDGAVGMFGDSYYGFTQWAAVSSGHPALRAIVPRVTCADLTEWLTGVAPLYGAMYLAECWTDHDLHSWPADWSVRPLATVCDSAFATIGARSDSFDRFVASELVSPYEGRPHPFDRLTIPVLHMVGWFDNIGLAHMRDYERLVADPELRDLQFLFAGASDHESYALADVPVAPHPSIDDADGADRTAVAALVEQMLPTYLRPALDFFDAFVARKPDVPMPPPVRWEQGHADWREAATWPPPDASEITLYLDAAGRATLDATGGSLVATPAAPSAGDWTHDPSNLVPSAVENPFAFLFEYPDESELERRRDVLTFTSAPFPDVVDLAGPVTAMLAVQADGPGGCLHVRLLDVSPELEAHAIVSGQAPLNASAGPTEIRLGHTGYRVQRGHRLRLHVAASDYPLFLPDPGTGGDPWHATTTQRLALRLRAGGPDGSRVVLSALTS